MGLQTLSSRVNDPQNTFVLTVGIMNGGAQSNIIADEVELVGTTRAFDKAFPAWGRWRAERAGQGSSGMKESEEDRLKCVVYESTRAPPQKEANPASLCSAAPSKGRGSRGHSLLPMEGGAPKGRRLDGDSGILDTKPSPRGEGGERSEPDRVLAV